jgi:hypothetical protein
LDLREENQKQQLALAAANQKRLGGWQPKLALIASFVAMALVMGGRHVDNVSIDGSRSEPSGLRAAKRVIVVAIFSKAIL